MIVGFVRGNPCSNLPQIRTSGVVLRSGDRWCSIDVGGWRASRAQSARPKGGPATCNAARPFRSRSAR